MSTTPTAWHIDYQAAADALHDPDYATHAQQFISYLSDEISEVYRRNTPFPVMIEEAVTGKAFFLFDMREVPAPHELIATHTYLLKESRIAGAYGVSAADGTKRPESTEFVMKNMFGRTEEVFGASYDKGNFVCHGNGVSVQISTNLLAFPEKSTLGQVGEKMLEPGRCLRYCGSSKTFGSSQRRTQRNS